MTEAYITYHNSSYDHNHNKKNKNEYILKAKVELILLNNPMGLQSLCRRMATAYWYSVRKPAQLSKPKPTFNLQPK